MISEIKYLRVEEYKYMWRKSYAHQDHGHKIQNREGLRWRAFGEQNIMTRNLPLPVRRKMHNQFVLPVPTYGTDIASYKRSRNKTKNYTKRNEKDN